MHTYERRDVAPGLVSRVALVGFARQPDAARLTTRTAHTMLSRPRHCQASCGA